MTVGIIGGGAAGLMAACKVLDSGSKAVLFERNDHVGRKLAITGKGRCNVTNSCDTETLLQNVQTNGRFLYSAFRFFDTAAVMEYFEQTLGVPLKTERGNRVFPQSDRAYDVVDALRKHILDKGGKIVKKKVQNLLLKEDGSIAGISFGKERFYFDSVILATGGMSYPQTGSDGNGYLLAKQAGHTVTEVKPSLVPLEIYGKICPSLMGLSLKNVALKVIEAESGKKVYEDFGEMLFTHFGVSGPMILSASAHLKNMEEGKYKLQIDFKPALDEKTLDHRLLSDFEENKNKDYGNSLGKLLPSKLIPVVVSLSHIDGTRKVNTVTKDERKQLVKLLKSFELTVKGFRPISEAIVTSGGVSVKEINPKTMESKSCPHLYFAGELMDVDAYTGGFNLQIAFSTGALAAYYASKDPE